MQINVVVVEVVVVVVGRLLLYTELVLGCRG
jgi:hypothetical protein